MANRIQMRRDTAANWTAVNPILAQGEPGFITDSVPNKMKIGNGVDAWSALPEVGLDGAAGATGGTGATGQGFTWRGAWVSGTAYAAYDVVSNAGSTYDCILATSGTTAPGSDGTHWALVAQKGTDGTNGTNGSNGTNGADGATGATGQGFTWRGAWVSGTAYSAYDVVSNAGSTYDCILATSGTTAPGSDGTHWALVAQKGTDGTNGTNGTNGSNGTNGTNGTSFTWRSAWVSGTTYAANDVVSNSGSSYICILATSGTTAPGSDGTHWSLVAQKGADGATGATGTAGTSFTWKGAWVSGTAYVANDVTSNSGSSYICILATSGTTAPGSDGTHWSLVAQKGADGATGTTGTAGTNGTNGRDPGFKYTYSTTTTAADPGSGTLRFNNATLSAATALYISETDGDANALAPYLQSWDDSTSTQKGYLIVQKDSTPGTFAVFSVTGTITDNGTWDTVTVAYVTGSGTFANTDVMKVSFSRTGDAGAFLFSSKGQLITYDGSAVQYQAVGNDGEILLAQSGQSNGLGYVPFSSENLITNGNMQIWQRGTSFTSISTGVNKVAADRWRVQNGQSNMTLTASQDTSSPATNIPFSLKLLATTGSGTIAAGDNLFLEQVIEGYQLRRIAGKTFTLSFWVKATKTGTFSISFENADGSRSYVTTFTVIASGTWEKKSVTVTHDQTGTWDYTNGAGLRIRITLIAGSTFKTSTLNAWQSAVELAGSAQTNWFSATNDAIQFSGFQLELGTLVSTFGSRSHGHELLLCQRYFHTTYAEGVTAATVTGTGAIRYAAPVANGESAPQAKYPVEMRTTPTLVMYSPDTGTAAKVRDLSTAADVTTSGVMEAGTSSHSGQNFVHTATHVYRYHYTADAEI